MEKGKGVMKMLKEAQEAVKKVSYEAHKKEVFT
jgi:hypothetical protein